MGTEATRSTCVVVAGVIENIVNRTFFNDYAPVEDVEPFSDLPDDSEVVRDEEVRDAELVSELAEEVEDLRLDRDVQRRHRLVADKKLRSNGEGPRDRDPLALSTGKGSGLPFRVVGWKANERQ